MYIHFLRLAWILALTQLYSHHTFYGLYEGSAQTERGMETFLTKNATGDRTILWLRTPRTEWNRMIVLRLRTKWNGMESDNWGKKEQERNNLAEGSCFRTEWSNFKKFGTCPALTTEYISMTKTPSLFFNCHYILAA